MRRSTISILVLLVSFSVSGCAQRVENIDELRAHVEGMNVIVVLFDAAAASHFEFLGYHRPTTPFLSELAEDSFVFENAYAQASATPLSILSLFTGAYPIGTDLPELRGEIIPSLAQDVQTLAQSLAPVHPNRLAWSANRWVCEELGYARGFTDFFPLWADSSDGEPRRLVKARQLRRHAIQRIPTAEAGPFFAYLHFIEPHLPYDPPEPYASLFDPDFRGLINCTTKGLRKYRRTRPDSARQKNIVGLYDGNLAYADAQLRLLLEPLIADGRFERSILIFLSDHGESFWEHGSRGHGLNVYEEVVHVPLFIRVPGLDGKRISDVVELVDLFPTLLALFDLEPNARLDGSSLIPKFFAESPVDSSQQIAFFRNHERSMESGIREGRYKLNRLPHGTQSRLFDLVDDPTEVRNINSHRTPRLQALHQPLLERLGRRLEVILSGNHRSTLMDSGADSLDAEAIERLKALGYFN